jgi:orotidine-5'-phosphate decarboxylase
VVPGVRPKWYKDTRHEQEVTPREAVEKGADIIICGGPIMKDQDKVAALKRVLSELKRE